MGWNKIGGGKVYTLAYADDLVLLVENEDEMRSAMESLKGYLRRKGVELNPRKSKILRFRKREERIGKGLWRWKGKIIKEVEEFRYWDIYFKGTEIRKSWKKGI